MSKFRRLVDQLRDIIVTDVCCLLPCIFRWIYFRRIKKDIYSFDLVEASGKKGKLYQHGEWNSKEKEVTAILILHGLYSHPLVMEHLAKMAKETNIGAVFSFYVSYDEINLDFHRILLNQAIQNIEKILSEKGCTLKGIVLVGHSMGAIEAAYKGFVELDKRIISIISIAGRLKVVECNYSPCRESLKSTVNHIHAGVQLHHHIPLYQIVGRRDWNASLESTLIRKGSDCFHIVEDAMHFNILFHKDLQAKFPEFLQKSIKR